MGGADMFAKTMVCPECRYQGAKKGLFSISCPNPNCKNYDHKLTPSSESTSHMEFPRTSISGNFDPGDDQIKIVYRNFRGENNTYKGARSSLRAGKLYVSLKAVPSGKRITFRKKFIANLPEVEAELDKLTRAALSKRTTGEPVTVKYRNHKGQELVFNTDSSLIGAEGDRVILRLKPEGKKFYLKKSRIHDLAELKSKCSHELG